MVRVVWRFWNSTLFPSIIFLSCQLQNLFSISGCTFSCGCTSLPSASSRKDGFTVKEELVKCCSSCCVSARSYGQWLGRSGFCLLQVLCSVWLGNVVCGGLFRLLLPITSGVSDISATWLLRLLANISLFIKKRNKKYFKKVGLSKPSTFKEQPCFHLRCWETFYFPRVNEEEFLTKKIFFLLKLRLNL